MVSMCAGQATDFWDLLRLLFLVLSVETLGKSSVWMFNNYLVPKQYHVHCLLQMVL